MKILLLSTAIEGGGAANACLRLYLALREAKVEVRLLVLKRPKMLDKALEEDERIVFLEDKWQNKIRAKFAFIMERLEILWHNSFNKERLWQYSTASFGLDLSKHEWIAWADVIHLQWINHGTLSIQAIKSIQRLNKPLVWTLHDLWALTALAHLPNLSKDKMLLFASQYAEQKTLDLNERGRKAFVYSKKTSIAQAKINYIAVSSFVRNLAEQLLIGKENRSLEVIAPALNTKDYQQAQSNNHPFSWHNPSENYLLVSAARLDDPIKGANLLLEFTQKFKALFPQQAEQTTLLLLGKIKDTDTFKDLGIKHIALGHISDKERIKELYSLADITLSCSLFETFGLTLVESLALGTPVLSFDCGGARDIIQNGVNGYLLDDYDCELMAKQCFVLLEELREQKITKEACQVSILKFSAESIAQKHIAYYQRLLKVYE